MNGAAQPQGPKRGRLVLAGAPLGNPADASARLREALATMAVIAAEDTRRLRRLCADLGVQPAGRVLSFFEANESARIPELLAELDSGNDVMVITDAGMPAISDPGFRIVHAALHAQLEVGLLPGPSAVTSALAVSGLAVDRFCFEGFLPRKSAERRRHLQRLADEERTMVFFEAPHRVAASLTEMVAIFGADRAAALCRELSKTYEQVVRASLGELAAQAENGAFRGEITLVLAGHVAGAVVVEPGELAAAVAVLETDGHTRKEAIAVVAARCGVPKRTVYEAVLAAKDAPG